jgi:hypothetical protein
MKSGKQRKTAVKSSDALSTTTMAKGNRSGRVRDASRSGQAEKLSATQESSSLSLEHVSVKPKMGRPDSFTQERADQVCAHIIEGKSLRAIADIEGMPSTATILKWLRTRPEFALQYARAKEEQAEAFVEEMIDIADDGRNDWMERLGPGGVPVGWELNGEHVQRTKLRLDARKWIAAKLKPKKYGDLAGVTLNDNRTQVMVVMPGSSQPALPPPAIDAEYIEIE